MDATDIILKEIRDIAVGQARMEGRIANIEASNQKLNKIVIDGNGKAALTDRVECLEANEDARKKNEVSITAANTEHRKNKWDLKTKVFIAFCVALFGMLSSFGSAYLVMQYLK